MDYIILRLSLESATFLCVMWATPRAQECLKSQGNEVGMLEGGTKADQMWAGPSPNIEYWHGRLLPRGMPEMMSGGAKAVAKAPAKAALMGGISLRCRPQ